jgi:hypothetical protein
MARDEDNMSDDHNRGTCLLRQCNEKAIPGLMLLTRVLGSDVTHTLTFIAALIAGDVVTFNTDISQIR